MDVDRIVKFLEAYVRDYAIYVFGVLASSNEKLRLRNMRATGTKLWSYAIISVALGNYVFNGAISPNPDEYELGLFAFIRTMWFWFLIALGVFLLMKLLRATENLLDTLTVALKVLPVAFVVAAFAALTASAVLPFVIQVTGTRDVLTSNAVINLAKIAFLATQFIVITRYFVLHLRPKRPLNAVQKVLIRATVPLALLVVNTVILLWPAPAAAQGTSSPPAASQVSCEGLTGWALWACRLNSPWGNGNTPLGHTLPAIMGTPAGGAAPAPPSNYPQSPVLEAEQPTYGYGRIDPYAGQQPTGEAAAEAAAETAPD